MARPPERKLILVRHSMPEVVLGVPASQWHLSDEGRRRCEKLAERLRDHDPAVIIASQEPKAVETGQIVADLLRIPFDIAEGLHEHERGRVESLGSREEFQALVAHVLEQPEELIFGQETGDQARTRFARALDQVIDLHPAGNLAVVSHGTVMTLFLAHAAGLDPVPSWKNLGLPAFAVLSLPDLRLLDVVENQGLPRESLRPGRANANTNQKTDQNAPWRLLPGSTRSPFSATLAANRGSFRPSSRPTPHRP